MFIKGLQVHMAHGGQYLYDKHNRFLSEKFKAPGKF